MKSRVFTTAALLALVVGQNAHVRSVSGNQARGGSTRTTVQAQPFINVEGADLKSKIEAATRLARSRTQQSPFWLAYSFDVRPGVAVDPGVSSFNGSMTNFGSVTLFFGNSAGAPLETRNLGVFTLLEPSDGSIMRIEVYNLERQNEFSGFPVYWMGRGGNQESLDRLKLIAESNSRKSVAEQAAAAIGLHDAAQVVTLLKELVRKSSINDVRTTAIFWLGFTGGEHSFLAEIVRDEREHREVREAAVAAIGRGRDAAGLQVLQNLYGQVTDREVREQIIHTIGRNENKKEAADFLLKVAKTDGHSQLREAAVRTLGRVPGTQAPLAEIVRNEQELWEVREAAVQAIARSDDPKAISTLESLFKSIASTQVRENIVNAVARNRDQSSAMSFLVQVAKKDPSRELREGAVSRLGRMAGTRALLTEIAGNEAEGEGVREAAVSAIAKGGDAAAFSSLQSLYESVANRQVKEQILNAISKNQDNDAALAFLIRVAESDSGRELREQAISRLARFPSPLSLEALARLVRSAGDADLHEQAVRAISKKPADEAIPLLIQFAQTHPSQETREAAIRCLGKSSDERAKEFFKQVLLNKK
jgi:HEAT repeat protein